MAYALAVERIERFATFAGFEAFEKAKDAFDAQLIAEPKVRPAHERVVLEALGVGRAS